MPGAPKRSYEVKLDRALEHIESFRRAVTVRGHDTSDLFIRKLDQQTGEWVVILGEIPEKLPAIVGDALQNLRSTLDHLVHDLVIAYAGGKPVPDPILEACAFPIFGPRPMTKAEKRNLIGSIDPLAQKVIEDLQPSVLGAQYQTHALWRLHDLARIDRHRIVHAGVQGGNSTGIGGDNVHIISAVFRGGVKVPGTEVARYRIAPADPNRPMYVNFAFTANVSFGDGPLVGERVEATLADLQTVLVNNVIPPLRPFLDVPPPP